MIAKHSHEQSQKGEGVEVIENRPHEVRIIELSLELFDRLFKFFFPGPRAWKWTVHREKNLHWVKTAKLDQKNGPENILCHRKSLELLPLHNNRVFVFLPHLCCEHPDQI